MAQVLDFQSLILALQKFWIDQGCLLWQPYYTQIGAGTMNPATFLRVLGPEPWNIVYVEPSIRPDDARYGENPNRMQQHYQLQVILKPDPGNPQEIYLRSLEAIGIDQRNHDFRFVEDNWEQPALGAWGLGWEVWLDGQEITQFTYFQQAGGQLVDPVAVELTYGLDRIAIALQRVHGFTEIQWNRDFTAGDLNLQAEQEHSKYYFEVGEVGRLRQMYDLYEAEAKACLERGLVLPAHDYILKCSHTFNVLDTRGAIGVTERQAYFGRMRELARKVSEAYLDQRQRLEYPFLKDDGEATATKAASGAPSPRYSTAPAPFLLEIGTEELPSGDLNSALEQLKAKVPALLGDLRLEHGEVTVQGTPRRLVVQVQALSPRQPDLESLVKGPPARAAFDSLGQPTKAAEGFARSKGLSPSDLQVKDMDGGSYVVALVKETGRPTAEVLSEALPGLIGSLRFDKVMRWNSTNVSFSRPVRWLLALLGEEVIPFKWGGMTAGRVTRGLRFEEPYEINVASPDVYEKALESQGILLDPVARKELIRKQVEAEAARLGGALLDDPALLDEVTNLVEAPHAFTGSFDASHLDLPRQVLISVMKKHQRYFPVQQRGEGQSLLPHFIVVRNGDGAGKSTAAQSLELVREGNEHVIRARFADAAFFIRDDMKRPLEGFLPRLGTLAFQAKLGSMLDKSERVTRLVDRLADALSLQGDEVAVAHRAAELCKADLATRMVIEMTSLQGIIGQYYALHSGETPAVAQAIFEHYLPRFAGDALPKSKPGLTVGLADRLDTLVGLFAAGLAPTGAKDPFAQRRAALGLVGALIEQNTDFDLHYGLEEAAGLLPIPAAPETMRACLDFIVERLRNLLLDMGYHYDIVDAVVAVQGSNLAQCAHAVRQLAEWVRRPDWRTILPAFARCVRITRDQPEIFPVDPAAFAEPEEGALYEALVQAEAHRGNPASVDDFLSAFLPMIPAINAFFDKVLVMAEDPRLRQSRLGLLQRIAFLANGAVDLSKLEGF